VLLEKRPPSGIWGGLWSLPEADVAMKPAHALRAQWGVEAAEVQALEPFEHAFTHFTLEVTPWRIRARCAAEPSPGKAAMWIDRADLARAPLPSPVRRLLAAID